MERTAQKQKSPAKHSLSPRSAGSSAIKPLPALPRILLPLYKLLGSKWVEQKQENKYLIQKAEHIKGHGKHEQVDTGQI